MSVKKINNGVKVNRYYWSCFSHLEKKTGRISGTKGNYLRI